MAVDLLAGIDPLFHSGGIVKFRDGTIFYSTSVGPDSDGDIEARIEDGVYYGYENDGHSCDLRIVNGRKRWVRRSGESGRDIVEFTRCAFGDPRADGLPSCATP